VAAVAEEFYPDAGGDSQTSGDAGTTGEPGPPSLRDKLDRKAALLRGTAA
jgi:hypothetical protein